jgi:hypothetical protein
MTFSIFGTLAVLIGGVVFFFYMALGIKDSGSPRLAKEWKSKLEEFTSLEEAKQKDPEIQGQLFRNGEWVFGYARDSHNRWHRGGGTLVLKDSRGNVRVYFGHVCGPHPYVLNNPYVNSLDAFYKDLPQWEFKEQDIQ